MKNKTLLTGLVLFAAICLSSCVVSPRAYHRGGRVSHYSGGQHHYHR